MGLDSGVQVLQGLVQEVFKRGGMGRPVSQEGLDFRQRMACPAFFFRDLSLGLLLPFGFQGLDDVGAACPGPIPHVENVLGDQAADPVPIAGLIH